MERVVKKVAATRQMHTLAPLAMPTVRKTACYIRVSTLDESQDTSFQAQRTHFTELIENSPDMVFAGLYADDGISGTGTAHRHGFQNMVRDALDGKFSLILTKSLSRFSRNVLDSISTIRQLKAHGVEVRFEKESLSSFDSKSELLMTIISSLSQEESRSISENVTWGLRQGFEKGKISLPYSHFMGYEKGVDGPVVNHEQAAVVQSIYRRYLEGATPGAIARDLEAAGIPSPTGRTRWHPSTINSMLTNPCYKGLTIRQKTFTTDFLTHKSKKNEGELPQYIIENSHTPIIPEETWELVQLERIRRAKIGTKFSAKGPLASRLVCGDCGAFFGSKVWHSQDQYRSVIWRCNDKYKPGVSRVSGSEKCATGHVTEEQVYQAFSTVVQGLIAQRPAVIAACEAVLDELMSTADLDQRKQRLVAEQARITERVEALMNRASREVVDDFSERYSALESEMNRVTGKLSAVEKEKGERAYCERQCRLFLRTVGTLGSADDGQDVGQGESAGQDAAQADTAQGSVITTAKGNEEGSALFLSLVDKVVVGEQMRFILRDGSEWMV